VDIWFSWGPKRFPAADRTAHGEFAVISRRLLPPTESRIVEREIWPRPTIFVRIPPYSRFSRMDAFAAGKAALRALLRLAEEMKV
jgi:hypothetical protein